MSRQRLTKRERELIEEYGPGSAPEPGTLFYSDYRPFEYLPEDADLRDDLAHARRRFWTLKRERQKPEEAPADAELSDKPVAVGAVTESNQKNRGGRSLSASKAIYIEIIRTANTPDGLPDRQELTRRLKDKFPNASESNLRSQLAEVYKALDGS